MQFMNTPLETKTNTQITACTLKLAEPESSQLVVGGCVGIVSESGRQAEIDLEGEG